MSSKERNELSFRARCSVIRMHPLRGIDISQSLASQVPPTSTWLSLVDGIASYEGIIRSDDYNCARVRQLLGDVYCNNVTMTDQMAGRYADKVSALLASYRILDFEVRRLGPTLPISPTPVPQTINEGHFGTRAQQTIMRKLCNWKTILTDFKSMIRLQKAPVQAAVPNVDSTIHQMVLHLQHLSESHFKQRLQYVVDNFRTAALHLTFMQETAGYLPEVLRTDDHVGTLMLPQKELEKFDNTTREKIHMFLSTNSSMEIRQPLHMSLLISMLVLLLPLSLPKYGLSRVHINSLCAAIGNQQPINLVRIEQAIWTTLNEICKDSSSPAILNALNDLVNSPVFVENMALPDSDDSFKFFEPPIIFESSTRPAGSGIQSSSHEISEPPPLAAAAFFEGSSDQADTQQRPGPSSGPPIFYPLQAEFLQQPGPSRTPYAFYPIPNPLPSFHLQSLNIHLPFSETGPLPIVPLGQQVHLPLETGPSPLVPLGQQLADDRMDADGEDDEEEGDDFYADGQNMNVDENMNHADPMTDDDMIDQELLEEIQAATRVADALNEAMHANGSTSVEGSDEDEDSGEEGDNKDEHGQARQEGGESEEEEESGEEGDNDDERRQAHRESGKSEEEESEQEEESDKEPHRAKPTSKLPLKVTPKYIHDSDSSTDSKLSSNSSSRSNWTPRTTAPIDAHSMESRTIREAKSPKRSASTIPLVNDGPSTSQRRCKAPSKSTSTGKGSKSHTRSKGKAPKKSATVIEDSDPSDVDAEPASMLIDPPAPTVWTKLLDDIFIREPEYTIKPTTTPVIEMGWIVTAWGPSGEEMQVTPIAHDTCPDTLLQISSLVDLLEKGYHEGKLLHLAESGARPSVLKVITHAEYLRMSDSEMQEILRTQHVVVTHIPHAPKDFQSALEDLDPLPDSQIPIQDHSLPTDSTQRTLWGKVRDLADAVESSNPRILNALNFPKPYAGALDAPYSSDSYAIKAICNKEGWIDGYAFIKDIRWGLGGLKGAFHPWHLDSDGFGTFIEPVSGAKWWFFARPRGDKLDFDTFNKSGVLFDDNFNLDLSGEGLFDIEAIILAPGTRLIMRPNTLHAVYTIDHAVCDGGHFYATSTMRDTFVALVHTLICDTYITNITHHASRFVIAQMINFYHTVLVKNFKAHNSKKTMAHVPNPMKPNEFMDLLVVCCIGALMNVLSFRTYTHPDAPPDAPFTALQAQQWTMNGINGMDGTERQLCCMARGQSLEIIAWLSANFRITSENGRSPQRIFSSMLTEMCKMILDYHDQANRQTVRQNPNFQRSMLMHQIDALMSMPEVACPVDPNPLFWVKGNVAETMLPGCDKEYILESIPDAAFTRRSFAQLLEAGQTSLDTKYANHLEIKLEHIDVNEPLAAKKWKRAM